MKRKKESTPEKLSPSRVYKTNAKNQLYQSMENLPKELKSFSGAGKKTNMKSHKLEPLNKRLEEARMNGLNASFQVHHREYAAPLFEEYDRMRDMRFEGKDEAPPVKGIDWGPDPEPVFSTSQFNPSRQ